MQATKSLVLEPPQPAVEEEPVLVERYEENVIEVGRGLANYNSEQISKVKGMNR